MKKIMMMLGLLQTGFVFASNEVVEGASSFVSVGPGSNCTFDTTGGFNLQDALNTSPSEIRLVNSVTYTGRFITDTSVYIRGGYDSCGDTINDTQGPNKSLLDGDFLGSTLTIPINGAYILENIKIINGYINGAAPNNRGGGLHLTATDMTIKLDEVIMENNNAMYGAGIFKSGINDNVYLTVVDSIIENNITFPGGRGGGIYFEGAGEVIIYGETQITGNKADQGGGLYFREATATLVVGTNSSINSGITQNEATSDGGGVYSQSSTIEITGGTKNIPGIGTVGVAGKNFIVLGNIADSDNDSDGDGGGLYFSTESQVILNAITIVNNQSVSGAGIMLNGNSQLDIGYPQYSDCQLTTLNGCNFFINNNASVYGGGIYVDYLSHAGLKAVNFNNNRANEGTVAIATRSARINISSSVLYENGDSGNGFNDAYAIGAFFSSNISIEQSTAIKNHTTDSFIHSVGSNIHSYNNYFYNPQSGPWVDYVASSIAHDCQIVDDTNNSSDGPHHLTTVGSTANDTLFFVDEANKDFHLSDTSILINYTGNACPANSNLINNSRDIDNHPRSTKADLGADESLINDLIFYGSFEN